MVCGYEFVCLATLLGSDFSEFYPLFGGYTAKPLWGLRPIAQPPASCHRSDYL
jgi:hypothetical protein